MLSEIQKSKINILFGSGVDTIDKIFAKGIRKWLGSKYDINFITMSTHRSTELLQLAEKYSFDIFILVLNNMLINHLDDTGRSEASKKLSLIKYLKQQYNKPVLILCGYEFNDPDFGNKCGIAGADYFTTIPCDLELFVNAVEKCLEGCDPVGLVR